MIIPRLRLIGLTALLLPISLLAARYPVWSQVTWAAAGVLLMVAGFDGLTARRRFEGIRVTAPDMVRMTVERSAEITLELGNPHERSFLMHMGLALPSALLSDKIDQYFVLEAGKHRQRVEWPCRALRRGRFDLCACYLKTPSSWSLWDTRKKFALNCEIRAYPNLVASQKNIPGLFNRKESGLHHLRKIGKGKEFEQLREYMPGDNYEDIDWKATARRRYPVARIYQVEQSQEIYVVLDASRLSTRNLFYDKERHRLQHSEPASAQPTIFERYVTAALIMALAADEAADRFGLLIFGARPDLFIKAGRGRAHYNACREALYNRMAQVVSPDFDEVFAFIGTRVRKRALLMFLTNLDDPLMAESFVAAMPVCARRHVLLVNMVRPEGAYPLFSSADIHHRQGIYEHLAGHMLWSFLSDTRRRLKRYGAEFSLLDTERLYSQLVNQYRQIKQRQIL